MLIGGLLQSAFVLLRGRPLLGQIDAGEATTDLMIRMAARRRPVAPSPATPVVVVDFDDAAMQRAGWPRMAPRPAIARVVRTAVSQGARLVVVDLDLSLIVEGEDSIRLALAEAGAARLNVILVREHLSVPGQPFELVRGPIDDLVGASPWLTYASAAFADEPDGVVRRLAPALVWCDQGRARTLASAPVYAAAVLKIPIGVPALDRVDRSIVSPKTCASGADQVVDVQLRLPGRTVSFERAWDRSRILYRTGWPPREAGPISRVPGAAFLAEGPVVPGLFAGKVVIVGSSSALSRDLHDTPLGPMPGAAIVAAAVQQAETGDRVRQASPWWSVLFGALASAGTWALWLAFRRLTPWLNSEIASELLKLATSGLWAMAAWLAFSASAILSFAAPQYAVALFLIVVASHESPPGRKPSHA